MAICHPLANQLYKNNNGVMKIELTPSLTPIIPAHPSF